MLNEEPSETVSEIQIAGIHLSVSCLLDNAWLDRSRGVILCLLCYRTLPESTQTHFEYVLGHHLNIGTLLPVAKCRVCQREVSTPFPVRDCGSCFSHLANLVIRLSQSGRNLQNLSDPTCILVGGDPGIRDLVIAGLNSHTS